MNQFDLSRAISADMNAISPFLEMGAYEAMWLEQGTTFKSLAERFKNSPDYVPSDFVDHKIARERAEKVTKIIKSATGRSFGIRLHGTGNYPNSLRDAQYPVELLYYQGVWEFSEMPSVAVVGSRKPSADGIKRAEKLAKMLVQAEYAVVSGLAQGIDTAAHNAAIKAGGITIAALGMPLHLPYPKENKALQDAIAREFLVVSQVPVLMYDKYPFRKKRIFFPERNITMSALTQATIIVEAGETSGTLVQAREALRQGRKLFILDSCFHNESVTWPQRYEQQGAIRIKDFKEITDALAKD